MSHSKGGFTYLDKKNADKMRSVGKVVLSDICKKLFKGSVNLSKISVPIYVNYPRSYL